jgi:hypothetical protein
MARASIRAQVEQIRRQLDLAGGREEDVLGLPAATKWFRALGLLVVTLERKGAAPDQLGPLREALGVLGPVARVPAGWLRAAPGCRTNCVCDMALIAVHRWTHSGQTDGMAFLWDGHAGALRSAIEEDRRAAAGSDRAAGAPGR